MHFFSKKRRISAKKFGKLLGDVLKETLSDQFERKNLLTTQKQFLERNWEFDYPRYALEITKLYINMIQLMIVNDYHHISDKERMSQNFVNSWSDIIPEPHGAEMFQNMINLIGADQPLLSLSRIAAQNYFGEKRVSSEMVLYFGASAKAFNDVLEGVKKEVIVK